MSNTHTILVYGTLRPFTNTAVVLVSGYLRSLGGFPGIKLAEADSTESRVVCERITCDDEKLYALDRYEGYREDSVETSLYRREKITDDGSPTGWSWIYVYNSDMSHRELIDSGDWEQYRDARWPIHA